jgi:hypothetical protein
VPLRASANYNNHRKKISMSTVDTNKTTLSTKRCMRR